MTTTAGVLTAAVDAVVTQDPSALTVEQLQAAVELAGPQGQRLRGYAALASATLDARVGGRLPTEDGGSRSVAGWVAEATSESPSAAGRVIRIAGLLQRALPGVAEALLDGRVGFVQAEILTRLVDKIDDASLAETEAHLITTAQALDPVQLAAWVQHQIATWVEPVLDEDEAKASARRYLKTRKEADGSLWGSFRLAAGDSESLLTAMEPLARRDGLQDTRSAAQRRADALVDMCEQVLRHGKLPDSGGQRPQLNYTLPADWAARQREKDCCTDCRRCPKHAPASFADLVAAGVPGAGRPGYDPYPSDADAASARDAAQVPAEHTCAVAAWTGPQTRARMETLLCDARITRVLLDDLGQVKGLESLTDNVTPAQRRALAARDVHCAVRGCTRPPAMCDAHHLRARKDGGPTTLDNLVLLCRRHHVLWHLGKIRLRHLHVPWITGPLAQPPPPSPPPPRSPAEEAVALFGVKQPVG